MATRILTVDPQRTIAARFMVRKLWTFFAYPNPSDNTVQKFADVYTQSGQSIREVMRGRHVFDGRP